MSTQKEETRLRLLEAARKLLLKRGFHGVSLEDIAEAAGVSRQAVYKSHFASKAELLLELVQHVHIADNLDEFTKPVYAASSGLAQLEATIRAIVLIEARVHDLALVLGSAALTDAGAAAAYRDRMEVKRGALRNALQRSEADGHFGATWTLERAVDMLAALLSVDTYQQLVVEQGWEPDDLIQKIWEFCECSFLLAPKANKPGKTRLNRRR